MSTTAPALSPYTFRPAVRQNTPLIIGIAGPTKSGKTYSALRMAMGLAKGGPVVMLNAEGARGHQYAERFKYLACDLTPPFRPTVYTAALKASAEINPAVVIIDSASHFHDGPGGILEWHEEEMNRLAGNATGRERDKFNFTAWIKPKAAENEFIYTMLGMHCPVILCLRAKEKLKILPGKPPIDLGWQPIVGERVAFETIVTLMLPPHSKGIPDLTISELREPFDELIDAKVPIDERLGERLAEWARGGAAPAPAAKPAAIKGAPVLTTAQKVAAARDTLRLPDDQFDRIAAKKLGAPLAGAPDEEIEAKLIPFLRLLAQKNSAALDELASILADTAAA